MRLLDPDDPRWVEVTPSQFTHEAEGLRLVRELLPSIGPYRAWSNFEFRDAHGKWHEVDLLVLGRRRMHLVELKYYAGTLSGDDHRWRRDQHATEDSPLKLARRKAQRLASKLQDALRDWAGEKPGRKVPDARDVVPFVQEAVFLHHPGLHCALPAASRTDLFGLDGHERDMGLPSITERLLEAPTDRQAVPARRDEIIAMLMARIGIVARRQREVGSWIIDEQPLAEGEGWQDWPAFHRVATTDRARIRFFVTAPGAAAEHRTRTRRLAEHEFQVMRRLAHDGLVRPLDVVDAELGIGLVYPRDQRYRRLDLWLADHRGGVPVATQLAVLRQVAEAVGYAHRHRVVHRGLTPQAVSVRDTADGRVRALVGDWQTAGSLPAGQDSSVPPSAVTLLGAESSTDAAERLAAIMAGRHPDADRQLAAGFQAPEGMWQRDADRVRLDVYALGALAYYLLVGRQPAADRSELRERLRRDDGLDLAADLPQVPSEVRDLVLEATRPAVRDRLADVTAFLKRLDDAERALAGPDELAPEDILEARQGTVVEGRYRVERRLGAGSTAVGLQVTDLADGAPRVLKVARDDAAAGRLTDEAEVLGLFDHPRLVRLIDGPLRIGSRTALVLEHAGDATLGDVLAGRARQSIDLLERWGTDLLDAVVELDRVGVTHRDIKPANLGVAEARKDRAKHLVLFDFSLARAGAGALTAGTPPYLDPFLDSPGRRQYDTAAERYAAAVVLFEMATGATPVYGDGLSDPSVVGVEATIAPSMFDPAIAEQMTVFFRRALHPEAACRFDTAAELLAAWRAIYAPVPPTLPEGADDVAKRATLDTELASSGLSPRALSALGQFELATVADLLAVDPVRLNRLSGVADATRREIKQRARDWRARFGETRRGPERYPWQDPVGVAEQLRDAAGSTRATARRGAAALLLGLESDLDAFATHAEVAEALGVSRPRANQYIETLQDSWAGDPSSRDLLDALSGLALDALSGLGGVATVRELAGDLLTALGGTSDELRVVAGLLRVALDRADALRRAEADDAPLARRRRGGRLELVAVDPALLDVADALARRASELVDVARQADETLVPAARASRELGEVLRRAVDNHGMAASRVAQLAAALSPRAALSGRGELHHVDLSLPDALRLTLGGIGVTQRLTPHEVRSRVRARFPALPPLPTDRHRLDGLVDEAGLDLIYDETAGVYRSPTRLGGTAGLGTRASSQLPWMPANPVAQGGHAAARLAESARTRSFLALGVDAYYTGKAIERLTARHGVACVDMTRVLIEAMREHARVVGLSWETVRAADAAAPGTRDAAGLAALVQRALPAVDTAIERAMADAAEGSRPVLLVETAPLARYGHLGTLARWTDIALRRTQAVWLLVPQLAGTSGAVVDGRPLPLAAPGQFVRLDTEWLGATTEGACP
ncbi:MAG: BREX system serine/threonine kinase PglW [Pseudonocardiaceae bacterium]